MCMRSDSHTCFFLFLFSIFSCLIGDVAFSEFFLYHLRFLFVGEYVVSHFLPNGVFFLPCDHGLNFWHQLMLEFNQKSNCDRIGNRIRPYGWDSMANEEYR